MATARALILQPGVAGNFHCVSRCVRRSWLCGVDPYSGQSYEHRREWIEQRIHLLAEIFAVGIHSYAVMSNHVHLVIRVEPELTTDWTDQQVAERGVALHCPAKFSDEARLNRIEAWRMNPDRVAALRVKLARMFRELAR